MKKIDFLQAQAARAERLARSVVDALTIQRLQAFAAECEAEAQAIEFGTPRDASQGAVQQPLLQEVADRSIRTK
jgi:hypothetical protein